MKSTGLLSFVAILAAFASSAAAQTKLTPKAQEWLQANPGKQLAKVELPGQSGPYVYEGGFGHDGVDLEANEVLDIQASQVLEAAKAWVKQYNEDPNNTTSIKLAGIEYLGPTPGKWWEKKGKKPGAPGEAGRRYHKFGGQGRANLLTYPAK